MVARDQVDLVRNEYGGQDFWAGIVRHFVRRTGPSGRVGFDLNCSFLEQKRFDRFHHSDFFAPRHIREYWIPTLRRAASKLRLVHSGSVESEAQILQLGESAVHLDEQCYTPLKHARDVIVGIALGLSWLRVNPDIYTAIVDRETGTCRGYLNAIPLTQDKFDSLKRGKIRDNAVTEADVEPYLPGARIHLYIMSIITDPALRKANHGLFNDALDRLVTGLCEKLQHYALTQGIQVVEIAAVAWTEAGERMCRLLCMTKLGEDEFGHPVYWSDLKADPTSGCRVFPGLASLLLTYRSRR